MEQNQYIATTFHGLENVLKSELLELGMTDVTAHTRAVEFTATKAQMYEVNYKLRTGIKIQQPLKKGFVKNEDHLYKLAQEIPWEQLFSVGQTFAVQAVANQSAFNNSHFVALKVKDAIVDRFKDHTRRRPFVNVKNPDYRVYVHIYEEKCSILLDCTGEPLFKRGHGILGYEANINEVLAAGMIKLSGWTPDVALHDPMCGSATFLAEAAGIATGQPSGIYRKHFAFMNWKDYDSSIWDKLTGQTVFKSTGKKLQITGGDYFHEAITAAESRIRKAGMEKHIEVFHEPFKAWPVPEDPGMIITNPPYGKRLTPHDLNQIYQDFGSKLKHECEDWTAWVISSNKEAVNHIGLKPSQKITLYNGALECQFLKYEMYEGSKKASKNSDQHPNATEEPSEDAQKD